MHISHPAYKLKVNLTYL